MWGPHLDHVECGLLFRIRFPDVFTEGDLQYLQRVTFSPSHNTYTWYVALARHNNVTRNEFELAKGGGLFPGLNLAQSLPLRRLSY